jgi:hypothetical protein
VLSHRALDTLMAVLLSSTLERQFVRQLGLGQRAISGLAALKFADKRRSAHVK